MLQHRFGCQRRCSGMLHSQRAYTHRGQISSGDPRPQSTYTNESQATLVAIVYVLLTVSQVYPAVTRTSTA